jgi:uncharacterized surface protein with fasciclin (FAS1) repeats
MRRFWITALLCAALVLAVPLAAQNSTPTLADLLTEAAQADVPEYTRLLEALQAADPVLLEALSDPDAQLTLFAPTDAAFEAQIAQWGDEAYEALLANPQSLMFILTFHAVRGVVTDEDLATGMADATQAGRSAWLETVNGQYADVTQEAGGLLIDGAPLSVDTAEAEASNGILHTVDALLLPEPRTLGQLLTDSEVIAAHELAAFSTALQAADPALLDALNDPRVGGVTVFAPTDAAFAVLGADAWQAALETPDLLGQLLSYHLLGGVARSGDLAALLTANEGVVALQTIQGADLVVTQTEQGVFINDALLTVSDIDAQNGVIHVIDAVLLPPPSP